MNRQRNEPLGYACAYTPLVMLRAAGYVPYRVLPLTDSHDQAGLHLHDNLCPHVKKILDRAMGNDLPVLGGMVFMNSCDAMRRLSDAWRKVREHDRAVLIDLPVIADEPAVRFFAGELRRLAGILGEWSGRPLSDELVKGCILEHNRLSDTLSALASKVDAGSYKGGRKALQKAYTVAATESLPDAVRYAEDVLARGLQEKLTGNPPAVFLFGNILPDMEVFDLFEASGARIVDEDLCTGSRLFQPIGIEEGVDLYTGLSRAILERKPCARTFNHARPGEIAQTVVERTRACDAKGVIFHTAKFCDPYLARLPYIRETLRKENIPMLVLEGDCTTRSIGQHRTRIEAFIEMLR